MKYASVCSGVEAASLAWMPLGWQAAWFSEIEPFPCAVLKERFPNVPNLGDMTKIKVENLENGDQRFTNGTGTDVFVPGGVDLLVGGTPCQSFSVAGKREGLDGASGLARTFVQLLESMHPRWFVWKNVPGCLSSRNKQTGIYDFNFLLAAFAEVGYTCGWRILDAQYTRVDGYPRAVPQRRRRVFVVGHLGGEWQYPAEVLFEPHSLSWNTPPRRVKGQGFTSVAERSIGATGFDEYSRVIRMRAEKPGGGKGALVSEELSLTLGTGNDQTLIRTNGRLWDDSDVNPTLNQCNAGSGIIGASNQELFAQNFNGLVMESNEDIAVAPCLECGNIPDVWGANGKYKATCDYCMDAPFVEASSESECIIKWNKLQTKQPDGITAISISNGQVNSLINTPELTQTLNNIHNPQAVICLNDQGGSVMQIEQNGNSGTLRANTHGNEQIVCVHGAETPICNNEHANPVTCNHNGLENVIACNSKKMGLDIGFDVNATLNATDYKEPQVVCYENHANDSQITESNDVSPLISSRAGTGGGNLPLVQECYSVDRRNQTVDAELGGTLTNCGGGDNYNTVMEVIAFEPGITKREGGHSRFAQGVSSTLRRDMGDNQTAVAIAENIIGRQVQNGGNGTGAQEELAYTQNASGVMGVANHATVRRLLPVECERLMGFPDNHTRIPWKGKPEEDCPDSPRYKACGNSMCVNVMRWIGMRIENVERKMEVTK